MLKYRLVLILLLISPSLFAQKLHKTDEATVIPCSHFAISPPLAKISEEAIGVTKRHSEAEEESEDREHRKPHKFKFSAEMGSQWANDSSIMQRDAGTIPSRAPIQNIAGQTSVGFRPFDPSGAAGPNHYVQMINATTLRVYNKTTGAVMYTATLGNLWSPATANNGDPIVMYDKAADRWFLAQFGSSSDNKIYIAVSTSPDPTGSYYTYTYTSPQFPDYLKFSVWADGYYMTSNQTQKVFVFERSAMLAGTPGARSIYQAFSPPEGSGFFVPLPGDAADGTLPALGTPCPIFSYSDNGWGAGFSDAVNIYHVAVTWGTTPTEVISLSANVATASFDGTYNASWNDVSQPGTNQKLDGIGGTLMYRAQWKTWSGYNTVVLNWGVYISSTQRSIMWCELRQNQTTGTWSMYQQGIYTPDANTRWMGSIAMDNNGSIGLAYLKSNSSNIYPGLYYTGRRTCDPLGTLPLTEEVAIAGTISQTGTNRVGDYSQTVLDPDGITFWHTGEYMGGTTGGDAARTRIFSFQIPSCVPTAAVTIAQTAGGNPLCQGSSATFTATPVNGGAAPSYQWQVNGINVGTNSPTYTTSTLTNGQNVTCIMTSNLSGVAGNPATSNAITVSVTTPSAATVSITASATTICAGTTVTYTATPVNGGSSPAYQWKVNGVTVGSNSPTYSSAALNNGDVVTCVMTSNSTCVTTTIATSNAITMIVNGSNNTTLSISASSTNICSGTSVTFTANAVNPGSNPVYQWMLNGSPVGTNSTTYTTSSLTNGQIVSCILTSSGVCGSTATLGTGTLTNAVNGSTGAAYPTYYGNGRQQYIIRATELTALGYAAGNILSIGFNTNSTVGNPSTLNGYTIKIGTTTAVAAGVSFLNPTFTTVFGPVNYTPTVSALNTHNFSTPFYWNGTSNLVVDICFSNQVTGVTAYQTYRTSSSFVSSTYYQADGVAGANACTQATGTTTSNRPNMTFNIAPLITSNSNNITMSVTSSPSATITPAGSSSFCQGGSVVLNANTGAGLSYQWLLNGSNVTGATGASYTATTTGNYTVQVSNGACSTVSSAVSVTSNPIPTASISAAGSTTFCSGGSVQLNAQTGTGYSYQWKLNGSNIGGATSASYSATSQGSYTVTVTSNSCSATSSAIVVTVNSAPSSSITPASATTFCAGSNVVLNANTGAGLSYQWLLNGSNISGATGASYTASSSGNYTVSVSNGTCSSVSSAVAVTVNSLPSAIINAGGSLSFCAGGSVLLNAQTGAGYTYQWLQNASNISGATGASYSASASGTYTVSVSSNGCSSVSSPVVVTVNNVPSASVTPAGSTSFCSGGSVVLNANTGAGLTYQWLLNGSNITGAVGSSYTASGSGNYSVMVSNANCSSVSSSVTVSVTATPSANVSPSGSVSVCTGGSVQFTANTGSGYTYQWQLNGSNITGATGSVYQASASGSYTVIVSSSGCSSTSAPSVLSVNSVPTASVTPSGSINICQGSSSTLTGNAGSGYTYQWLLNGSAISGATSIQYSASATGNYSVVVSNGSGCSSTSAAVSVNVIPGPVAQASASGPLTFCNGSSVQLNASTGVGYNYQWLLNNLPISGANGATYSANQSGNYSVIVNNGGICSDTSSVLAVTVLSPPAASITPTGTLNLCAGQTQQLQANTGTGFTYQWYLNSNPISGAINSVYTATAAGVYTVLVSSAAGCAAYSSTLTLSYSSLPVITQSPVNQTQPETGTTVFSVVAVGAVSYQWQEDAGLGFVDLVSGGAYAGVNTSVLTIGNLTLSMSNYQYRCVLGNGACILNSSPATLTVTPLTSLLNVSSNEVKISPNPSSGNFVLNLPSGITNARYRIVTSDGKLVKQDIVYHTSTLIDAHELARGVYFIQIYEGNEINPKYEVKLIIN